MSYIARYNYTPNPVYYDNNNSFSIVNLNRIIFSKRKKMMNHIQNIYYVRDRVQFSGDIGCYRFK